MSKRENLDAVAVMENTSANKTLVCTGRCPIFGRDPRSGADYQRKARVPAR